MLVVSHSNDSIGIVENRFFGSDRTPNKSFEPLSASHTHRQTDKMSNIYQWHPVLKKATAKTAFGCLSAPILEFVSKMLQVVISSLCTTVPQCVGAVSLCS